jgi:hypothetical protein
MKRFHILTTALLTLAVFGHGYNQTRRTTTRQEGESRRDVIGSHAAREVTEVPKGEALVEKLPEGVEGVELKEGFVKIMPGYKFVKKDNKVTVMRSAAGGTGGGRLGVGGAWSCVCKQGDGGCSTMVEDNQIFCAPGGEPACSDKCVLSVVIRAAKAQIFRY